MISIWEKESFQEYDVVIVGAGISGLSTAASLTERDPKLRILVIEKGNLPTGASTKNAGFACFGSISELTADRAKMGLDKTVSLVAKRWTGLQRLRNRLGDQAIEYRNDGGYELIFENKSTILDELTTFNESLKPLFGGPVFGLADEKIKLFGFGQTAHLIQCFQEGQLHTGKMIESLWKYCTARGVMVLTGTAAVAMEPHSGYTEIRCPQCSFNARAVAICTNAFSPELVPVPIKPGRGTVLLVQPQIPPYFNGSFHYDEGFYYFRNFKEYLLFGGGRNLATETETTTEFAINEQILLKLQQDLETIIIPGQSYHIEMKWSGIMGFGETKEPYIQQIDHGVFCGIGLNGMGVAIGSLVGDDLATLIYNRTF